MKAKQVEVINMRLDFMSMVLAVLARSLPPREAAHAVQVIGERVVEQLGEGARVAQRRLRFRPTGAQPSGSSRTTRRSTGFAPLPPLPCTWARV